MPGASTSVVRSTPTSSGLYDVLDLILDKGLVIDAYVRVSVVGIELLTIDLRVVIASVDTYLRFAEAVDRLNLQAQGGAGLDDLVSGGKGNGQRRGVGGGERRAVGSGDDDSSVRAALERVREAVGGDDKDHKSVVRKVREAIAGTEEGDERRQRDEGRERGRRREDEENEEDER